MTEFEFKIQKLKSLLQALVELNRLNAESGMKAHFLYDTNRFLKNKISEVLK